MAPIYTIFAPMHRPALPSIETWEQARDEVMGEMELLPERLGSDQTRIERGVLNSGALRAFAASSLPYIPTHRDICTLV